MGAVAPADDQRRPQVLEEIADRLPRTGSGASSQLLMVAMLALALTGGGLATAGLTLRGMSPAWARREDGR